MVEKLTADILRMMRPSQIVSYLFAGVPLVHLMLAKEQGGGRRTSYRHSQINASLRGSAVASLDAMRKRPS